MHMNSVPQHLLSEDRQEYERILDEALRSAPHRPELASVGQRLNPEQLRTMALNATAQITTAAAIEYQHYVKVREEVRHPAPSGPSPLHDSGSHESGPGSGPVGLAATMGEVGETAGAGVVAVVAVLAPVLAGTAAAIFLLVGYLLRMVAPDLTFGETLLTTGWVFGGVTAVAILIAAVGLLITALRNRPSRESGPYGEPGGEVAQAREAWRDALLERGIMPFLRDALATAPGPAALHSTAPSAPSGRMPHLGYDRPGFTSPGDGSSGSRPRFSSPDYTSPDFGGPEHKPE
ncbi:hypothetical protein ABZX40_16725 [Streptomyces sp. NPDC004610]|uniref:hypothetical protein n=1 Tax=unclassified Streptomyces TaxID=2593676 RepID=UPI0033A92114